MQQGEEIDTRNCGTVRTHTHRFASFTDHEVGALPWQQNYNSKKQIDQTGLSVKIY